MCKKIISVLLTIAITALSTSAFAVGESGVPSLIIPPGARANGMGSAFVAVADDATASWWNPGGLAFLQKRQLTFMHSQLVPDLASDVYYEYLGYTNEISNFGTLGFSITYLTYGESFKTDNFGNVLDPFTSWEVSGVASFALPIRNNIGIGLSMKFIHADYAPAWATQEGLRGAGSTVAAEIGMLWKFPSKRLNVGAAIANIGPDIAYIDPEQSDPLPTILRVGAAFTATSSDISRLLFTFDIEQSLVWLVQSNIKTRRGEVWHAGAEYLYLNLLAGRLGYVYDADGDIRAATFGLGFIYKDRIRLDYASVPQAQDLERVHRWSIGMSF
ncbi:MAG: PorV/PorQ family protein [Candidatus Latescibacteria bacterium]|nr:PorV/PorQ family protein [Candidatus Latescibacterota bacterium]NIM21024.1 PorV/PorQ family protein [Candidatus Latescibacterota bacterium]NIM65159.1 PorV/PorQ family protein [Candidatus Latescibacterota bacterium]NIO01674.1 PorV/PorQ family protein [Candidatus Latescibacterota bacterium]NIO28191.1 PorV/PorQ family protein [Candidatus Latescibacterota bacterium]